MTSVLKGGRLSTAVHTHLFQRSHQYQRTVISWHSGSRRHQHVRLGTSQGQDTKAWCWPASTARYAAIIGGLAAALGFLAIAATPADSRVLTERMGQEASSSQASTSPNTNGQSPAGASVKQQVQEIMRFNTEAREAVEAADYKKALDAYTTITRKYPGLAITNYARIGRALLLYQIGNTSESILELEDLEASLRGFAEVHAALASIIYTERPSEISYAEEQFDLASEFDSRYLDVQWVEREKHWPPAMLTALNKFAALK